VQSKKHNTCDGDDDAESDADAMTMAMKMSMVMPMVMCVALFFVLFMLQQFSGFKAIARLESHLLVVATWMRTNVQLILAPQLRVPVSHEPNGRGPFKIGA
jgi:hypothetical protein